MYSRIDLYLLNDRSNVSLNRKNRCKFANLVQVMEIFFRLRKLITIFVDKKGIRLKFLLRVILLLNKLRRESGQI